MGSGLGVVANDPTKFFLELYRPEIQTLEDLFTAGRATFKPVGDLNQKFLKRSDMVPTMIHSRIMEQILVAVNQSEPVLLVGETGTGKTSAIQYCAARTGNELRVVNMSRQSQASDLLGAFRPIDQVSLVRPVFLHFHQLMTKTFTTENESFLTQMGTALSRRQFDVLTSAMEHVMKSALNKDDASLELKQQWKEFSATLFDTTIRSRFKIIQYRGGANIAESFLPKIFGDMEIEINFLFK
jgi:midasin